MADDAALEAAEKNADGGSEDESLPPPKLKHKRRHQHTTPAPALDQESSHDNQAEVSVSPPPPAHVSPVAPPGLSGGWQALLKKKKQQTKKNKVPDQAAGLMDLVQTPSSYTAWKPADKSDKAIATASSTKSDLLAAERALDGQDGEDGDDSGSAAAASFLQVGTQVKSESRIAIDAASLVLEKYAATLGSAALLNLAHARLGAKKLRRLWQHVQDAAGSGSAAAAADSAKEAQVVSQCRELLKADAEAAQAARNARHQAAMDSAQAAADRWVLEHEAVAHQRVLEAVQPGIVALQTLLESVRSEANTTNAFLQQISQKVRAATAGDSAQESALETERLAQASGLASAGITELQDLVESTLARRSAAQQRTSQSLAELHAQTLQAQQAEVQKVESVSDDGLGAPQSQDVVLSDKPDLRSNYRDVCRWTLSNIQVKKHRREGETVAVNAATAVLAVRT